MPTHKLFWLYIQLLYIRKIDIQWKSRWIQVMQPDPSFCITSSTICHVVSHDFERHFNTPKTCNADFPSQSAASARERNLHHLQRPSDNGPHISFYSPSSTRLTNCDLNLALWHGSDSNWQAKRHECYMILFYSGKHIMPPTPLPKCRDKRGCGFLALEPLKTYNT